MQKAVFLDRDGVINHDYGYVGDSRRFRFLPGVKAACRRLSQAGYHLIVVTNQGGIARGYYSEEDYQAVNSYMLRTFADACVPITAVYYCPYHPLAPHHYRSWAHWRKPLPGMLLAAARDHDLVLSHCAMVGDKETDMLAASAASVPQRFFIGAHPPAGAIACRSLAYAAALLLSC